MLAAAVPIEGEAGKLAWQARSGDDGWQNQAWYFYDAVGELRFAFNWLANAVTRAVLYAAEIDPETGQVTGPTDDPRAQAAAQLILGGADARPQAQSTMALHWQVTGETFVLVVPQDGGEPDRWVVVSSSGMRQQGGTWQFKDPLTGVWVKLVQGTDRIIRIWSPHPQEQTHADSAMRAALPICTEIERSSQNIIGRLESRLKGSGLHFLPQEIDFATKDDEPADAQTLSDLLVEAAEINIRTPGTAAAHVPIFVQVPSEYVEAAAGGHVDMASDLDNAVVGLRDNAINRLGQTLDMPREVALGQTAEANHWSGWLIDDTTYKIFVEPFLAKLGAAFTTYWYRPTLAAMGVTDPERFVLDWDISELVSRPDDSDSLKDLWDKRLISDAYLRGRLGIPDDAIPPENEIQLRRLEQAVQVAPTLAADAQIARMLFGIEIAPAAAGVSNTDVAGADAAPLDSGSTGSSPVAVPDTRGDTPEPGLVAAAELVVFDALSRAGGRLLTPAYRGQFKSTPRHELHTVIPTGTGLDRLMADSFQFTDNVAYAFGLDPARLREQLQAYVRDRLESRKTHDRELLRLHLRYSFPFRGVLS